MMAETKLFEVRDRNTFIPVLAVRVAPFSDGSDEDYYLLRRAGYGDPLVILTKLDATGEPAHYDPHAWNVRHVGRTFQVAHAYITEHWFALKSGDVVDVEFIFGETERPKVSERETEAS